MTDMLVFVSAGSSAFILDVWGAENAPYSQLLFAAFLLGCTVSPQLLKPFLSDYRATCAAVAGSGNHGNQGYHGSHGNHSLSNHHHHHHDNHSINSPHQHGTHGNHSTVTQVSGIAVNRSLSDHVLQLGNYDNHSLVPGDSGTLNGSLSHSGYNVVDSSMTDIPCVEFHTRIHFGFIIIGVLLLVGALLHLGFNTLVVGGCRWSHIHLHKPEPSLSTSQTLVGEKSQNPCRRKIKLDACKVVQVCLVGVAAVLFGCHSTLFGSFLVEYTVTGLNWSIKPATDITSLFWASNLLSKISAAVLSNRLTVTFLLGCSAGLILTSNILILLPTSSPLPAFVLWICVVGTGLGLGSVTSYCIILGLEVIPSSDVISSLVLVCIYVGKVSTSPLIGYVLSER